MTSNMILFMKTSDYMPFIWIDCFFGFEYCIRSDSASYKKKLKLASTINKTTISSSLCSFCFPVLY